MRVKDTHRGKYAEEKKKKNLSSAGPYLWKDSDDKRKAGRRTEERHIYRPQQRDALKSDIMRWPAAESQLCEGRRRRGVPSEAAVMAAATAAGKEAPASP